MIHNISRFIAALALLATAQGAWAQTPSGNWDTWVNDNNIDWNSADAKAAAIPQSDDGSTVYISTAEQLAYYAYAVNNDKQISGSASGYYCGRTVELMADIDLSEHYWKPIGWNKDYYFSGYFHGNGHVITGIHVNGDPKSDNTNYYPCYGLFGYFHTRSSGTSTITDLVLKDFSITASFSGNNSAEFYLGGLVGRCDDNTAITNCLLVNGSVSKSGNNSWAHIGKVSGAGSPSAATANYYHNVSVSGWYSGYDSYALQTIGGETEARAVALTISSTHGSVALGGTVGRISGGIIYAPANETVTLNTTTDAGYIASLAATGLTLTSGQFTMPDNDDATITATVSIDPAHFSQDGDTYTINTAGGWNVFCDLLESGESFSGKTVQLGDDITVTRMAGGSGHEFTGTFDGGGHTLTFNYANTDNNTRTAPFSYVDGATIQNLIVGGTISGTAYRAAGIIGETGNTTSHITNCVSSVDISSGRYTGGFSIGGNVEIEGCVFNGKIKGTTYSGGFIGYSYSAQVIKNSLFAPQDGSSISGGTFYYNGGGDVAPVNSYYTQALGTAQGKACHSVTAGTDVTIDAIALTGTATQYTVSGITAYSGGGLQRGQTLYYGSDDQLSLTLTTSDQCDQPGYQYAYTASAGTFSGTTLTMPDEDVTISVNTAALLSDGQQHEVSYMTADGTTQTAQAVALDGHEAVGGGGSVRLAAGTYYVGTDITYANRIYLNDNVTLILADGKTMTLNGNTQGIAGDYNLTIYGQSLDDDAGTLRYNGTSDGIYISNYEQHSGNVSITTTTTGSWVYGIGADVTLLGGTLTVTANGNKARAIIGITHSILGGQLTATATNATGIYASASSGTAITLGWTRPDDRITASSISAPYGGTVAVANGKAMWNGTEVLTEGTVSDLSKLNGLELMGVDVLLDDDRDADVKNADRIDALNDGKPTNIVLSGRTLYKDGSWNTLCLPFDISTASGTLSGDNVQAMTINTTTSNFADGTLTLNFDDATTIPAGTPFIIKWDESGTDIENPVFDDVTVSNATNNATVEGVLTFTGTYAPVTIADGGDNTKLYLGSANTLYYPTKAMTIGCHRAYFQLAEGITAGEPVSGSNANQIRAFNLNFGDDEATGIVSAEANSSLFILHSSLSEWYTLDGCKLDGQPTAKGLYIHGGKKVAIK